MRYVIQRTEEGRWVIVAYNEDGQVGAKVMCSDVHETMRIFLMLEGSYSLLDTRSLDLLNEETQKVA